MPARLTDLAVEKYRPASIRREVPDGGCPGLYLLVQKSGGKSWAVRCRVDGVPTKITLGSYPRVDLKTARQEARSILALVDQGMDPREQRREALSAQRLRRANTLRAVAEQFRDGHMKRVRPRSWRDSWSALDRHVLGVLGDRPIDSVRRRDLHEVLDALTDKPGARHHALNAIGSLFRWAVDREIIDANPSVRLPRPKAKVRERSLDENEIQRVWAAAESLGYPFGPCVQLLLATGCRRGEIAELHWSEIDHDSKTIIIPAARYKNGRTFALPLNAPAAALIERLPRLDGAPFVFTTTGGVRPISGFSKMKRRLDTAIARASGGEDMSSFEFHIHDLRRTVRTQLSALGVPPHIAELVIGHAITGVQRHYDCYSYLEEKRAALESWGCKLQMIISK